MRKGKSAIQEATGNDVDMKTRWNMEVCAAWLRPERIVLLFGFLLGLACVMLTPPFQVADEAEHFFRIVQITDGRVIGERRGGESGGSVPTALVEMRDYFLDGDSTSGAVRWNRVKWAGLKPHLTQRADMTRVTFQDFRGMTLYNPVVYLPQSIGVWVARALHLPPLWMVYAGRLCALIVFMSLVFWAIRLTPICPWGFTVLALLPAVIFQSASLSADSMTNALLFLWTAWVFRCAYAKSSLSRRDIWFLVALGVGIGLCKSAYLLALGLVGLIPPAKFGGRRRFALACAAVVGSAVLAAVLWTLAVQHTYAPLFDDVDEWAQAMFILGHPLTFVGMVLSRFLNGLRYLFVGGRIGILQEFVGLLGWYAAYVNIAQISLAVLLWCSIAEKNDSAEIPPWHRWLVALILTGSVLAVSAANYMVWCPPGGPALALFGRYFHPIAPMALLLFHNRSFRVTCADSWKWLILIYFIGTAAVTVTVIAGTYL